MKAGDLIRVTGSRHLYRVVDLLAEDTEVRAKDIDTGLLRYFYADECRVTTRKDDRIRAGRN